MAPESSTCGEPNQVAHDNLLGGTCLEGTAEEGPARERPALKNRCALRDQIGYMKRDVDAAAGRGRGGKEVLEVVTQAHQAAEKIAQGQDADEEDMGSLLQVVAGVLPAWDASEPGKTAPRRCSSAVKRCLQVAQRKAAAIMAHGKGTRAAHAERLRRRNGAQGWLRLCVRAWREEVEHSKAIAQTRWRVRCVGDPQRRSRGQRSRHERLDDASCHESGGPDVSELGGRNETLFYNCSAVITMRRVSRMSRTQQGQPRPKEKGKWRRLVARLVEKTREEREATREMDEEGGEVGRSRSGREGAARGSYREARSYVHGGADGRTTTGTRRGCTRRAARLGMELHHWLDARGRAARRRMGIG